MNRVKDKYFLIVGKLYGKPINIRFCYETKRLHISIPDLRKVFPNVDQEDFDSMIEDLKKLPGLTGIVFDQINAPHITSKYLKIKKN